MKLKLSVIINKNMRDHTNLRAFELADEVVLMIYKTSRSFPKEEIYGLTSQMRRAGISVASNIVEGCARESLIEYRRFLEMSYGSLKELHYQFSVATRLGYVNETDKGQCELKLVETEKVLATLIRKLH
jgi:four helix bundle protein